MDLAIAPYRFASSLGQTKRFVQDVHGVLNAQQTTTTPSAPDQHGLVQHVVAQAPPPQHGQRREQPHHRPLHPMQVPGQHPLPASQAPPHYAQPREHWHVVPGEWFATDQTPTSSKDGRSAKGPKPPSRGSTHTQLAWADPGQPHQPTTAKAPSGRQAGHDQHHRHAMQHTKVNEAGWGTWRMSRTDQYAHPAICAHRFQKRVQSCP